MANLSKHFTHSSHAAIFNLEQVNGGWENNSQKLFFWVYEIAF